MENGSSSPVFLKDVREEWINAMFGRDFFASSVQDAKYKPPKQGIGLAGFPSYITYSATIPAQKEVGDSKLGITICRIPLGVYVRVIDVGSEAYAAGIIQGSVLLNINGIGVLGEPSHKLLERLWLFEGHFSHQDYYENISDGPSIKPPQVRFQHQGPVSLRFIKNGHVYTVVLFSRAPFGISWAPCGNFALIQRTYSHAAESGLKRGCLVAGINGKNLRTLDHSETAAELKSLFSTHHDIQIICAYTALSSRISLTPSGEKDKYSRKANKIILKNEVTTGDGVVIRKVREEQLEYGMGTFFMCGVNTSIDPTTDNGKKQRIGKVSDIAIRVASGEMLAPTGWNNPSKPTIENRSNKFDNMKIAAIKQLPLQVMSPVPDFPDTAPVSIVAHYDPLFALLFCLKMDRAKYRDDKFFENWGTFLNALSFRAKVDLLKNFIDSHQGERSPLSTFALQMVALLASKELYDSYLNQSRKPITDKDDDKARSLLVEETNMLFTELSSTLLNAAIMNEDFCQTAHFLLRTHLSILTRKREVLDGPGFSSGKILSTTHRQLKSRLMDLETVTPKHGSKVDAHESLSVTQDSYSLATLSALSLSSELSTLHQDKKKLGKNLTTFFRPKQQRSKNNLSTSSFDLDNENAHEASVIASATVGEDSRRSSRAVVPSNFILPPTATKGPKSILKKGSSPQHSTLREPVSATEIPTLSTLLENMNNFLTGLDGLCTTVEKALLKSFSQKLTEWALQPWSSRKDRALAEATAEMRKRLVLLNGVESGEDSSSKGKWSPIMSPTNSSEYLVSIDSENCYILPSAHFPILLSFRAALSELSIDHGAGSHIDSLCSSDASYGVKIEFLSVRDSSEVNGALANTSYIAHAAVAGIIQKTEKCVLEPYYDSSTYRWPTGGTLSYTIQSSWGYPRTLSLRLASVNRHESYVERSAADEIRQASEVGYAYIDLSQLWTKVDISGRGHTSVIATIPLWSLADKSDFDNSGYLPEDESFQFQNLKIEMRLTLSVSHILQKKNGSIQHPNRLLLYKHDDDVRQEMLAIQFIETCDRILKSSGLDLKIKTFRCMPVAEKRGFIEWVPGTVSMSEISKPVGSLLTDPNHRPGSSGVSDEGNYNSTTNSGAFLRLGDWCKYESLRALRKIPASRDKIGLSGDNPVQEFLRASSFEKTAPYLIRKEVMDTYIKSCAGYSVITYLLGVGDRHTDNLLLHPDGYFLHCDYSFLFGQDPKTYFPMRVTSQMINGMGGVDSDNFAKFLSLVGAAFTALREHTSVRTLLSMVRILSTTDLPSLSIGQTPDEALRNMLQRFRLDLSKDEAVEYIEGVIHHSMNSKLWLAVDVMHDIGKRL